MDRERVHGEDGEEVDEDSENSQPLQWMARLTQLRDLLCAHHIIGTWSQCYPVHCYSFINAVTVFPLPCKDLCFSPLLFRAAVPRRLQHQRDP